MRSESLGPIAIGQPANEIRAKMQSHPKTGAIARSEVDSLFHQTVEYPKEGISVDLVSNTEKAPQEVFSVRLSAPSPFRTKAGIGIGSSRAEVLAAYKGKIDKELSDKSQVVAESASGGLSFTFRNGKVAGIFLGQIAE